MVGETSTIERRKKREMSIRSIIARIHSLEDLNKILHEETGLYPTFWPELFASKEVNKLKSDSQRSEEGKIAWLKLRGALDEKLQRIQEEQDKQKEEYQKITQDIKKVLHQHFQPKGPWIDKWPRLGLFLRNIKNEWSKFKRIFFRGGIIWSKPSPVLYVYKSKIVDFSDSNNSVVEQQKDAPPIMKIKIADNIQVLIGPMPPDKEIDDLLSKKDTEVRILTLQAFEEASDESGKALPEYSYINRQKSAENLSIIQESLVDHTSIKTSTGEPVNPDEIIDLIKRAIAPSTTKSKVLLRINCKSGMERSNVVTSLLYSYVTDTPLLASFKHVHEQRSYTKNFVELSPGLKKLAINTYFIMLADKENPQRLNKFRNLSWAEISEYLEIFLRANLGGKGLDALLLQNGGGITFGAEAAAFIYVVDQLITFSAEDKLTAVTTNVAKDRWTGRQRTPLRDFVKLYISLYEGSIRPIEDNGHKPVLQVSTQKTSSVEKPKHEEPQSEISCISLTNTTH